MDPDPPTRRQRPDLARLAVATLAAIAFLLSIYIWVQSQPSVLKGKESATAAESQPVPIAQPAPVQAAAPAPAPPPQPPPASPAPAPKPTPPIAALPAPAIAPAPAPAPAVAEKPTAPEPQPAPLAGEDPPVISGQPTSDDLARNASLLDTTIKHGCWADYRILLDRSLAAALETENEVLRRFAELWKQPLFRLNFLRRELLGRFSQDHLHALVDDDEGRGLLAWWLTDETALEESLLVHAADDDPRAVLSLLRDAWTADDAEDKATARKYFKLALACAVVFDRPIKYQAGDEYTKDNTIGGLGRYRWYVEKNEAGRLVVSVDRSPATDLVWVVCAPVPVSELNWALSRTNQSRRNWGGFYGKIEYLMERAVEGENPYDEYTFAEILDKGGVCGDRSYFCTNTARANGIPAATLSGETDSGAHAWVALKSQPDEWDTDIGRIGGVSMGKTTHPQSGNDFTEQEFWLWNEREHRSRSTTLEVQRHLWLGDLFASLGRSEAQAAAVRHAHRTGPKFPQTWQALYPVIAAETAALGDPSESVVIERWRDFVAAIRREFREHPRMASLAEKIENQHLFPYAELDRSRLELARQRRRIARDSAEQTDLVAASLKREALLVLKLNPEEAMEDISRLYDRALREHGAGVTGFRQMAQDYFAFTQHDQDAALKAVRDIELAFMRKVETGSKEWFRANTEADLNRMICGFYRAVGNEARAERLEKRFERRVERAKRGAL